MFAFSPSWNCVANSFSRSSLAMPPVAAMLPAVSDASEVVSMLLDVAARGDELAVLVDDEDDLGVRVLHQAVDDRLDLVELLFVHHHLRVDHPILRALWRRILTRGLTFVSEGVVVAASPGRRESRRITAIISACYKLHNRLMPVQL